MKSVVSILRKCANMLQTSGVGESIDENVPNVFGDFECLFEFSIKGSVILIL